jgi:perosamine synthetase
MAILINQIEPSIDEHDIRHITEYLSSGGWLTEFRKTKEFEDMIASYTGAKHCVVVSNGTVSLFTALYALSMGRGDDVVVPDITMIATPNAVRLARATPILCEINVQTGCIDPARLERVLTSRTKAVFLVSLNGRFPADIADIQRICKERRIFVVEDAAQSPRFLRRRPAHRTLRHHRKLFVRHGQARHNGERRGPHS